MMNDVEVQVVIRGAGPAGLYLANRLHANNIKAVVLEKRENKEKLFSRKYMVWIDEETCDLLTYSEKRKMYGTYQKPSEVPDGEFLRPVYDPSAPYAVCQMGRLQEILFTNDINFRLGCEYTFDEIKTKFPNVKHIVHAVGAKGQLLQMKTPLPESHKDMLPGHRDYGMTLNIDQTRPKFDYSKHVIPMNTKTRYFLLPKKTYYMGLQLSPEIYSLLLRYGWKNADERKKKALAAGLVFDREGSEKYITASNLKLGDNPPVSLFDIELSERTSHETRPDDKITHHFIGDCAQTAHFFTGKGVNIAIRQADNLLQFIRGSITENAYKDNFLELQRENREAFRKFRGL
jgi:hypothetical protein